MDADHIIEGMQACVLAVSERGVVTYANRSAREALAVSPGDSLLGRVATGTDLSEFIELCVSSERVLHCALQPVGDPAAPSWECHGQRLQFSDEGPQILLQVDRSPAGVVIAGHEPLRAGLAPVRADDELDLRVRELNHRFKNGVQMMIGVLDGARRRVADEQARRALGSAMQQVQAIADVQNIVSQAPQERTIAASEFLQTLCDAVRRSVASACAVECRASLPSIPVAVAPHLALIVNELVTNAVKYAAPDRGAPIRVQLDGIGDAIVLRVDDEGPGISARASRGTGLTLVRALVKRLSGSFVVQSRSGTRCIVTVPMSLPRGIQREPKSRRRVRATR
jgi:two-component sensor histidine kinase